MIGAKSRAVALLMALSSAVAAADIRDFCPHPFGVNQGASKLTVVHIPKTAGSSFHKDIGPMLIKENCYMEMYSADAYMVSFFREPRAQVYSLFVQALRDRLCTALVLKPTDLVHVEFSKWVDHFYKGLQPNGSMAEKNCFGCYHPYNMQARAMSPTCTARNNVHRRKQENFGVHFYSESIQSVAQMEAHLGDLMHKLNWLGITEFYTASVCVYQHLSGLPYFPACVTSNSTSASARRQTMEPPSRPEYLRRLQSHDTHGVHLHPHMDVPPEVWKKVDALTKYDQRLYWMALRRFACGVGLFEQETGLSLDHLLIPGGWQWLFDLSDVMAAGWQHN